MTSTHPSSSRHHRSSPHLSPHTTFLTAYYQRNLERLWEAYPVHHYCRSWECLLCLFIPLGTIYICCNLGAREAKRQAEQEEKWADFQKEQQRKCVFQFHSFPSLIILSLPPHRSYLSHRYAPYDVDVQLLKGLPFMFAENGSIDEAKGVKRITIGLKFQSANTPEIEGEDLVIVSVVIPLLTKEKILLLRVGIPSACVCVCALSVFDDRRSTRHLGNN